MSQDWREPRPLIKSNGQQFVFDEATAQLIGSVSQPLVVVAIVGIYRTGKSYLMNRLAKKQSGFPLGDTVQSKTKGIWAWCLPHPSKPGYTLLLLDTEGLSDPEKASEEDDIQLLCLAVLLSSLFAYNAIGKIDQEMINRMYFLTQVLDRIKIKANKLQDPNYEEMRNFLPDFLLVVRDFSLELEIDNKSVTPDEYFNLVLQPRPDNPKYNRPRQAIQSAFCSHRCFVFARPVEDDDLFCKLESLKESDLTPRFLQQSNEFCQFIYSNAQAKKVNTNGNVVFNGKVWLSMAREYTSTINNGAVPAIETTFACVANRNNEQAVCQSMEKYYYYMKQLVLPLSNAKVQSAHEEACACAIYNFKQQAIGDESGTYIRNLNDRLAKSFPQFKSNNEQVSRSKSRSRLDSLYNSLITRKISRNSYLHADGYTNYQADLLSVQSSYNYSQNQHGCMHEAVLREFLHERKGEAENIRRAVEEIVRKKKELIAQERARKEAEERAERRQQEAKAAAEVRRREQEQREREQERLVIEQNRLERERLIEETRLHQKHYWEMQEARTQREQELAIRLKEEAKKQKQLQEAHLDRLRVLQQHEEERRRSQNDCCIL